MQSSFSNVLSVALAGGQGISSAYMIRPLGTKTWLSIAGSCSCVPYSNQHLTEAYTGLGSTFKIKPHAIWHHKTCPYAKLNCKSGNNFHRKCWKEKKHRLLYNPVFPFWICMGWLTFAAPDLCPWSIFSFRVDIIQSRKVYVFWSIENVI